MANLKNAVVLKIGREVHARNRHPWVFLGAVEKFPEFENGDILPVVDFRGAFLGYGYFNKGQSIVGRMVSFIEEDPLKVVAESINNAVALRRGIFSKDTTAYRVINGEGDFLPGLVADLYGSVLVLQINTLGMEKLKSLIVEVLTGLLKPKAIYEKCSTQTRKKEGLQEANSWLEGKVKQPILVSENGLKFFVDVEQGQKTGLFLDQRNMRGLVRAHAKDRTVLNCFAYTGGFSVSALSGGAISADSLDIDIKAVELTKQNLEINKFSLKGNKVINEDVFKYLENLNSKNGYDFIILDPPAFAKRKSDVENASRGYREINRLALQKLPKGGLLLTSSCSSYIDKQVFQTIVFQAAKDAKRNVKILSYHQLAEDHPVSLYYPEGDYLKSLLLWVE